MQRGHGQTSTELALRICATDGLLLFRGRRESVTDVSALAQWKTDGSFKVKVCEQIIQESSNHLSGLGYYDKLHNFTAYSNALIDY